MTPVRSGIDARVAPGGAADGPGWQVVYDIDVQIKSYQPSAPRVLTLTNASEKAHDVC